MADPIDPRDELRSKLLASDGLAPDADRATVREARLLAMIDRERDHEARVRRLARLAWTATFTALPVAGVLVFVARNGGGGLVEVARAALIVVGSAGILSLFLAMLFTVAWLFRSTAPKLAVIEERLAALETLLREDGRRS